MRNHGKLSVTATLVACAVLVACVGGGGDLPGGMSTLEPSTSSLDGVGNDREAAPGFLEGAPPSQEGAGSSSEPAPGGGGGGGASGFDCSGTYSCRQAGESGSDRIRLQRVDGVCRIAGSGSVSIVLGSDGSLTINGTAAGTWSPTGSGFTAVSPDGTVTCTRGGSDDDDDDDDDGDVGSPPSGSSGGSSPGSPGIPPVDAGSPGAPPDDDDD